MKPAASTVARHFEGRAPVVREIYDRLLAEVRAFGPVQEDPKLTSIHWNRRSAFAGVATRKEGLILTVKSATDLASPRIRKHEQASARRWHLEVPLSSVAEVDAEILGWLRASYALSE